MRNWFAVLHSDFDSDAVLLRAFAKLGCCIYFGTAEARRLNWALVILAIYLLYVKLMKYATDFILFKT